MDDQTRVVPRVSVVVPVRDRRELLSELLRALDKQTFRDFEVVVVDDGSTDGSAEEASSSTVCDRPVRVLRQPGLGAVAARGAGVTAAAGEILAFTDSDCVPEPCWLAASVAAIDDGADLVHGKTEPARPVRPLERSVYAGGEGLFPTCNVLYRRTVFEGAGGFDRNAVRRLGYSVSTRVAELGFGEDTLLAWRVLRSGADVRFVPEAMVKHHVFEPDFVDSLHRWATAAAFPALIAEVPELRRTLIRNGILLGARSRVPMYATLIALAARRPSLVAVGALWWASTRFRDMASAPTSRSRKLAALPVEMMIDVVTGSALIAGSLRARTVAI